MSEETESVLVVSAETPPPLDQMHDLVHGFERWLDPWHADAFPDEFKQCAPNQGERKSGWMQLDWCGNPVGFIADGAVFRKQAKNVN